MYCVAVSIRWVMSPVKINPGKRPEGKICKICVQLTALQKVTWTSVRKSKRTSGCYGNLLQVMSIKRKVKGQGYSLQKEKIQTDTDKRRDLKKWFICHQKKKNRLKKFLCCHVLICYSAFKSTPAAPYMVQRSFKISGKTFVLDKSLSKKICSTFFFKKTFRLLCFTQSFLLFFLWMRKNKGIYLIWSSQAHSSSYEHRSNTHLLYVRGS